jgi:hypothetical protein
MRHFILCTACTLALSLPARAGDLSLAGSVGTGYRIDPQSGRIATNVLVAPGFDLIGDTLRIEVGFVADLPDVEGSELDFQVRPMAVLALPILPIYARVVTGVTQIVSGPVAFAFGGAIGIDADLGEHLAFFGEAGFVPRASGNGFESVFEGRLGGRFQ